MSRSFDASSIVVLPILDVSGAITLGEALLTSAEEAGKTHKIPKIVAKARDNLASRHQTLRLGAAERLNAAQNVDGTRTVAADRRVDAAWGALHSWLAGYSKLPESLPQSKQAQTILDEIAPDGLKFLNFSYKAEWAESDIRLLRLASQKHDATIEAWGGKVFLDELTAAHREYGEILGITRTSDKPTAEANLRDALNDFRNALRTYVLRVSAQVDEFDPETVAFGDALLAPLTNWVSTSKPAAEPTIATPEGDPGKVEG